jgi:hypothetical protein
MDLDQLAIETFALKSPFEGKSPFDIHHFDNVPSSLLNEESEVSQAFWTDVPEEVTSTEDIDEVHSLRSWLYPETSGILFILDQSGPTFCLKGRAVDNIKNEIEDLKANPDNLIDFFRTDSLAQALEIFEDRLLFFETETRALAEVVIDQLFYRRFPIEEDMLCNLSDPGFSWWLKCSTHSMNLYFRSHGINRAQELIKLGPVGDRKIAAMRFTQLQAVLVDHLKLESFKCSDKGLSLEVKSAGLPYFQEWIDFLRRGVMPDRLLEKLSQQPQKTLYYYTRELATLRQFWLEVENQIENKNKN